MKNQTILIQIDTVSHGYTYEPTRKILNKFDIQTPILTCTPELLLAHKLYTVFERKRMKGRDFFDIVFLLGRDIKPDMGYIQAMMGINTPQALHAYILDKCVWLDLAALQRDAQPFLFNSQDQSVVLFPEIIAQARFL